MLELLDRVGEASAMRRGELAELYSDYGLPGPAVAVLSRVNVEQLEPHRFRAVESNGSTSVAPLVAGPMTGDVVRLRKAVERETCLRRDRPWWVP